MIQQYSSFIYLQRVDTDIFRGVSVSDFLVSYKSKTIDILQTDKVIVIIFATLVAGAISDDCLKKEIVGKLFFE